MQAVGGSIRTDSSSGGGRNTQQHQQSVVAAAAPAGILQLERFLETILKQSLREAIETRDCVRSAASQCVQLRKLFREMQGLSRERTFISRGEAAAESVGNPPPSSSSSSTSVVGSASGSIANSSNSNSSDLYKDNPRAMGNRLLVDLGNHFYAAARVRDAGRVHLNVGCGVLLEMSIAEADGFLRIKEAALRATAMAQTREALRLVYRIRLVTEAIARLSEREMGLR